MKGPIVHRILTAVWCAVFVGCGFVLIAAQQHRGSDVPLVLWIVPLTFAVVIVHEAGHLLAAAASGLTVLGMSVGRVWIQRRRCGVRLRWMSARRAGSGFAFAVPDPAGDIRSQMLRYIVGGPMANLIVAAVLLPFVVPASGSRFEDGNVVLAVFVVLNACTGIANLVPFRTPLISDGSQLRAWWRRDSSLDITSKILAMYHWSAVGIRAADLAEESIAELQRHELISVSFFGHYLALRASQQRGEWSQFDAILKECEEKLRSMDAATYASLRAVWTFMLIEKVFEQACRRETTLADVDRTLLKSAPAYLRYRFEAALACIHGDRPRFDRMLSRAHRDVRGVFDRATRSEEPPLLERLAGSFDRGTSSADAADIGAATIVV